MANAEEGETIILTQDGRPVARLQPVERASERRERHAVLNNVRQLAASKRLPGSDAARSQNFLYGKDGLPI
ncbi:type II toxin-antitoxin system prevent-host-death family antitoxin [Methylobacterium sp. Leaf123]|uniref:type II toxin-antitoxin system Phd/YefM family antitoxin n=1 Tax=Methylobacterium sp. Leaf123 TaxID=1736264 RepID=UPI00256FB28A|nr:type II toxin-antitoxin system prevent-host-death family antitoxin [Methylobacterium sp. Leaf123]